MQIYHEQRTGNGGCYVEPCAVDWVKRNPLAILYGFYSAFEANAYSGPDLMFGKFLVYENVKFWCENLYNVFYQAGKCFDKKTSLDITAKTLASLLSYLAVNEHDCWFELTYIENHDSCDDASRKLLWANMYSIAVGNRDKYVDFLPVCKTALKAEPTQGITLQVDAVALKYMELTGVDITKHGFAM